MTQSLPVWFKGVMALIGLTLLFFILKMGEPIIVPLIFAGLLAMLLEPLCNWLESKKIPRPFAILLSMLVVLLLLAGIISLITMQFVQFSEQIPEMRLRLNQLADELLSAAHQLIPLAPEQQMQYLERGVDTLIKQSGALATTFISATTDLISFVGLMPIYVFFLMYYRGQYKRFLMKLVGRRGQSSVENILNDIQGVVRKYILGMLTVITILAALNTTGLVLLGIDHAVFFGVFAGFMALIPFIGIIIGSIPPILFALLMTNSLLYPLGVITVFAIVQFLEGNFITPKVMSSQVSINPLIAIIALLVGSQLWGIEGMILSVPLVGILKTTFDHIDELKPFGFLLGNQIEEPPIEQMDGSSDNR